MPPERARLLRHSAALAVYALLVGCAGQSDFRDSREAVVSVYRDGAPLMARTGKALPHDQREHAFFPIALHNVIASDRQGSAIDFESFKAAGFNTIVAAPDQPVAPFVAAAARAGLQAILANPNDADLVAQARSPAVLAWQVDAEPSLRGRESENRRRMEAYRERRLAIRTRDPDRPALVLDVSIADAADRSTWNSWRREADMSAIMAYPFRRGPVTDLGLANGPAAIGDAIAASNGSAPQFVMLQAFAHPLQGWYMPSPEAARTSLYAALVQGASGIIWFSYDSYFSRNLGTLGIAPTPAPEYPVVQPLPGSLAQLRVRGEQIEESARLWREVVKLNQEVAELSPALLAPTSKIAYSVAVRGGNGNPVRTLLKPDGDSLLLLAVNLGNTPVDVRFEFGIDLLSVVRVFSNDPAPGGGKQGWTDAFAPFGVRLYRLKPVSSS